MDTHESCGGMNHYTSYRHFVKGKSTKIPNLLKVSEQAFDGFHYRHGSLSIFAAALSWVTRKGMAAIVFSRQLTNG